MFSNPFDSFHDTVAAAKEEREQLDRLLTISTPRERLLVAVIALSFCLILAWLFFGSVSRSIAVDGVLVEPDEGLSVDIRSVESLVWVASAVAPQIASGMPASVEVSMKDGMAATLDGVVATVAAVPQSDGLTELVAAAPVSLRRVDIALDVGVEFASLAGPECRVVIDLGRQSPIALFGFGRP